ncbi:hypothetical protein Ancab_012199 [Ancistrocladus abbreviatus]
MEEWDLFFRVRGDSACYWYVSSIHLCNLCLANAFSLRKIEGTEFELSYNISKLTHSCWSKDKESNPVFFLDTYCLLYFLVSVDWINLAIAKRADVFGCPISYWSRSRKPYAQLKYWQTITVSHSLTEDTHRIIHDVTDALGQKGNLINIDRGAHDEPELRSALLEDCLAGASFDVFQNEPDAPETLFKLNNMVCLSHVGTYKAGGKPHDC